MEENEIVRRCGVTQEEWARMLALSNARRRRWISIQRRITWYTTSSRNQMATEVSRRANSACDVAR